MPTVEVFFFRSLILAGLLKSRVKNKEQQQSFLLVTVFK